MKIYFYFCASAFSLLLNTTYLFAGQNRQLPILQNSNVSRHASGHLNLSNQGAIASHYPYVIIGSGYGASVVAARLAQTLGSTDTPKIAVLERGREWLPGDFSEEATNLVGEIRSPLNPLGLLSVDGDEFRGDMDVIGASGLGGTSLLNAAISLAPPANVWHQPEWPSEIQNDYNSGKLETYFERAREMLAPNVDPRIHETAKTQTHLDNFTRATGHIRTGYLPLNINHVPNHENQYGVKQEQCTQCGNCCGGCNVGSKNTLTTNYLACAKSHGAVIFTQVEVVKIDDLSELAEEAKANGRNAPRYAIHYVAYKKEGLKITRTPGVIHTDYVFLGAGSAGSTRILMNSTDLSTSPTLGTRVSANGDVLGFAYNSPTQTNIVPGKNTRQPYGHTPAIGQTITAYADFREYNAAGPLAHQFVLLDGSVPRALASSLAATLALTPKSIQFSFSAIRRQLTDQIKLSSYPQMDGALNHSMVLLACGHDSSSGRYILKDDGIFVQWPDVTREESFRYITQCMRDYSRRLSASFVENPRTSLTNKMQATHPLGGCPMGQDSKAGTVNHVGQLFKADGSLHKGVFVVDGATIPRSLAAPPLLTITALAERSAAHFIETVINQGKSDDYSSNSKCEEALK